MNVIIGDRIPIHLINFQLYYNFIRNNIVSVNGNFDNNINSLISLYINKYSEKAVGRGILFQKPEEFLKETIYNEVKSCDLNSLINLRSLHSINSELIRDKFYKSYIYLNRRKKIHVGKHTLRDYKNNEFLILGYVPRECLRYFLLSYYLDPEPDLSVVKYLVKKDLKYKRSRFRDVYDKLIEDNRNIELVESINPWSFAEGINLNFKTLEDLNEYLGEVSETFIEYLDRVIERPVLTL